MNMRGLLVAPWRATQLGSRWVACLIAVLAVAGTVAIAIHTAHGPGHAYWVPTSAPALALGEFFLSLFVLSPCLLLALDARQLRLPRLQREAMLAVPFYAAIGVLLPSLLLGILGGYAIPLAGLLSLAVAAGLAIAVMPRGFGLFIWLLPAIFNTLQPMLSLPRMVDPGFPVFSALMTLALASLSVLFARRLLRSTQPYDCGLGAPMLLQFRRAPRNGWVGFGGSANIDASAQIRRTPSWLRPAVALRKSGPAHPVRSLRIALGGVFAPQTALGHLTQLTWLLGVIALFAVQVGIQAAQRHSGAWAEAFLQGSLQQGLIWTAGFGGSMLAVIPATQLMQRWRKNNAELTLLALLPGLGERETVKKHLLRASLVTPLVYQLLVVALTVALTLLVHAGAGAALMLALTQFGSMTFMAAFVLSVLGGRPLGAWPSSLLALYALVLMLVSIMLPVIHEKESLATGYVPLWLMAAWGVLLLILAWLGTRGWRGLVARPHPFLANMA